MWGDVLGIGRCGAGIAASARLRFAPLEIFAQRQLQPILPLVFARTFPWSISWISFWIFCGRSGLPAASIFFVAHRGPPLLERYDRKE
jgi:hypothetical protein